MPVSYTHLDVYKSQVQHQLVLLHIALKLPHNGGAGKGNALQHRGLRRKGRQALTQQTQGRPGPPA